jgi:alkylated DNA repair dioxygenase AlkB
MTRQTELFLATDPPAREFPKGFRYQDDLVTPDEQARLIDRIRQLPFREFDFHGFKGKRRIVSFGRHYDFSSQRLRDADDIPDFLLALREKAAAFAACEATNLQHVLVTEYAPGAGIGWHRDKAVFGIVVGVSLLSHCVFRLRRKAGQRWERVSIIAEPRSAYMLSGPSRDEWEHSIPPVGSLRYSVTFRNMRES